VDAVAVAADLDLLDASVAIEAWWWTGEVAAAFANPAWLDRAEERAARLARQAGSYADGLRRAAGQRLAAWRAAIGLSASRAYICPGPPAHPAAASLAARSSAVSRAAAPP